MTFNQAIEENILNDKPVFEIDGIKYCQFLSNGAKISQERLLAFGDIINEHSNFPMRKEDFEQELSFLIGDFQRVMNNVGNAKELNEIATNGLARITSIKQRMSLGFNFERIFDVSALWFIREGENPSKVDAQITAEKKAHFIKHPELNDFFFDVYGKHLESLSNSFRQRFPRVYKGGRTATKTSESSNIIEYRFKRVDTRTKDLLKITGGDVDKLARLLEGSAEAFHHFLEHRLEEADEAKKKQKAK